MKTLLAASFSVWILATGAQFAAAQANAAGAAGQPPVAKERDPVPDLAKLLRNQDVEIRRAAARALTRLPNTVPAIPALIESLKDPDAVVRDNAVDALAVQHPGDVVGPLTRALRDTEDANSRRRAADTLARIGRDTESAWPTLIELLKDENDQVRKAASAALRRLLIGKWD
jgi:HEAT repeat protein